MPTKAKKFDTLDGYCLFWTALFFATLIYFGYKETIALDCPGVKTFEVTYLHVSGRQITRNMNVCSDTRDFYVTTYNGAYVLCADRANSPITQGVAGKIVLRGVTDLYSFKLIKQQ